MTVVSGPSPVVATRQWRKLDRDLVRAWRRARTKERRDLITSLRRRRDTRVEEVRILRRAPGATIVIRFDDGYRVVFGACDERVVDSLVGAVAGPVRLGRCLSPGGMWYLELCVDGRTVPIFAGFAAAVDPDWGGLRARPTVSV
jgi:hypothetical protein